MDDGACAPRGPLTGPTFAKAGGHCDSGVKLPHPPCFRGGGRVKTAHFSR